MKKVLLDTNILIHREASTVLREDVGVVFRWLDRLHYEKCIHQESIKEIQKHSDPNVVKTFNAKLQSYCVLKTTPNDTAGITLLRKDDKSANDQIDTSLLAELAAERVDYLLTEDKGLHVKAAKIGLSPYVFGMEAFLEKVTAENPDFADYKVLSVQKKYFGQVNLADKFFDSFREDYQGFDRWFNSKANECAYVCTSQEGEIIAFLYLKVEAESENYSDVSPVLPPKKRLKIGTFKISANGFKLGERFLKILFDNALIHSVAEVYVTIFKKTPDHERLIRLLEFWGFFKWGEKSSKYGREEVLVRDFTPGFSRDNPRQTFPYVGRSTGKFIVPVYPAYHTELLPDSILNTESPSDFLDNKPNRNAIRKVYISRSVERGLSRGDLIVFYRTKSDDGPAKHTSVATTIGLVESVQENFVNKDAFIAACRKRSVFTDEELGKHWDYSPNNRPFVVNFLYAYSLPKRPNLALLQKHRIVSDPPRGFTPISDASFMKLMELSNADMRLVVH